ncbi:MAG: methyltransferase domain-containing protein, partial [Serratia rubidaea]|nr:methyltransferase domain-containing protein [Serratia rubidaea]
TDISASLLRSTADKLNQRATGLIEFNFEPYDFNAEPTRKHVSTGGFDVVLAVNALHNAHNLPASLRMLSSLLKEGGVLITSESICGSGEQVHQEFFLNLLPLPEHRQGCSSRFLSSEDWQLAIDNAGLKSDIAINSIGPELMLLATVSKI